jgi:hypothetical protein
VHQEEPETLDIQSVPDLSAEVIRMRYGKGRRVGYPVRCENLDDVLFTFSLAPGRGRRTRRQSLK